MEDKVESDKVKVNFSRYKKEQEREFVADIKATRERWLIGI